MLQFGRFSCYPFLFCHPFNSVSQYNRSDSVAVRLELWIPGFHFQRQSYPSQFKLKFMYGAFWEKGNFARSLFALDHSKSKKGIGLLKPFYIFALIAKSVSSQGVINGRMYVYAYCLQDNFRPIILGWITDVTGHSAHVPRTDYEVALPTPQNVSFNLSKFRSATINTFLRDRQILTLPSSLGPCSLGCHLPTPRVNK